MQIWSLFAILTGMVIRLGNSIKKYLLVNGINPYALIIMNAIIYSIFAIILYAYLIKKEFNVTDITKFNKVLFNNCTLSKQTILLAVVISSTLFMLATILFTQSINISPNPGYSASFASSTSVITVFLISVLLLNGTFNIYTIAGIFLILTGVVLINVFSKKK